MKLTECLDKAHSFVLEELENREQSFLPEPDACETGYIESAKAAERAIVEAREISDALLTALEELARLGNEPYYGNSRGNTIAQAAIKRATGEGA